MQYVRRYSTITEYQECLCGASTKQRPELLWAGNTCQSLDEQIAVNSTREVVCRKRRAFGAVRVANVHQGKGGSCGRCVESWWFSGGNAKKCAFGLHWAHNVEPRQGSRFKLQFEGDVDDPFTSVPFVSLLFNCMSWFHLQGVPTRRPQLHRAAGVVAGVGVSRQGSHRGSSLHMRQVEVEFQRPSSLLP